MSGGAAGGATVSVVVIAAGDSPRLRDAVRSVLDQDHRPLELVLFANGAPAGSLPRPEGEDVPVRVGASPENLGVARGRNAAAALARGDLLVFLDDDAVLAPGALRAAVARFGSEADVGAVAFRVVDPASGRPALWYHPYDAERFATRSFEAHCVIGCGHLIARERFRELGGYWPAIFREMEEVELSWRLLDAGWRIVYEPAAEVAHAERSQRHVRHGLASNALVSARLMPWPLALRQLAFFVALYAYFALRTRAPADYVRGLGATLLGLPRALRDRRPLRPQTVAYLRRVHAPQGPGGRAGWSLRPLPPPDPAHGQPARRRTPA